MIDGAVHEISSPPAAEKPFDLRQVDLGVPEEVYAALQQEVAYFEQLDGYHDSIDPVERGCNPYRNARCGYSTIAYDSRS